MTKNWYEYKSLSNCLKRFLNSFRQFTNIVTGDKTWTHYFEPVRKIRNKMGFIKHFRRSVVDKRSMSTNKVLYCILLFLLRLLFQITSFQMYMVLPILTERLGPDLLSLCGPPFKIQKLQA